VSLASDTKLAKLCILVHDNLTVPIQNHLPTFESPHRNTGLRKNRVRDGTLLRLRTYLTFTEDVLYFNEGVVFSGWVFPYREP